MPIGINDHGEIIELLPGNHLLLRSAAVTELISNKPSFIVRWGVSLHQPG